MGTVWARSRLDSQSPATAAERSAQLAIPTIVRIPWDGCDAGHGRYMVRTVRVIEASELIAADVFKLADQTRTRITFGDVERHLAQLANHPHDCTCGRCGLVSQVTAQRSMPRRGVAGRVQGDRCGYAI